MPPRSSLNFQIPGFVQPKTFEAIEQIPKTFDDVFNNITRARALEKQQAKNKEREDFAFNKMLIENPDTAPLLMAAKQNPGAFQQDFMRGAQAGFTPEQLSGVDDIPVGTTDIELAAARLVDRKRKQRELEQRGQVAGVEKAEADVARTEAETKMRESLASGTSGPRIVMDEQGREYLANIRSDGTPTFTPISTQLTKGGKRALTANNVISLNEGKAVAIKLPDIELALEQNKHLFDPIGGRVRQANPYDDTAQIVDAAMRTASQSFGRFMEGGVLRKEDEEKYKRMFPQLGDRYEVAKSKLDLIRRDLAQKFESDRKALEASGFDVSGISPLEIPPSIFKEEKESPAKLPEAAKGATLEELEEEQRRRQGGR